MHREPCQKSGSVDELMTPRPVAVLPDARVGDVWLTMNERRFRHMPVVDEEGRLVGILSQRDLLGYGVGREDARLVSELMHTAVDTATPDCCIAEAARHMLLHKRSCLPVVEVDGRLLGILTEADYLRLATRGAPACTCVGVNAGGS